jgi:predicted transcriptional regulator
MYDQELIPRSHFVDMKNTQKVIAFPYGHGGIIHEVQRILEANAATLEAMADKLSIDKKTIYNAIAHLRNRHNLKIGRYYNPKDRKYYFMLEN